MKFVRFSVPDPSRPGFKDEVARHAAIGRRERGTLATPKRMLAIVLGLAD